MPSHPNKCTLREGTTRWYNPAYKYSHSRFLVLLDFPNPKNGHPMAKAKRHRTSRERPADSPTIRIARRSVDFIRYRELLDEHFQIVLARQRRRNRNPNSDQSRRQAAHALACGTLVAPSTNDPLEYERAFYCGYRNICRVCMAMARRNNATSLIDFVCQHLGSRVLSGVFTFPKATSRLEEEDQLRQIKNQVLPKLRNSIRNWQRGGPASDTVHETREVFGYVFGTHLKGDATEPLLWIHVHGVLFVHHLCKIKGEDGLENYLRRAFLKAVDLDLDPHVIFDKGTPPWLDDKGPLRISHMPEAERIRQKRGKACSIDHATNLVAYALRDSEENDTPEIIVHRDELCELVDLKKNYVRSQCPGTNRRSLPHEFHPLRLGKSHCYLFPLDAGPHRRLSPEEYDHAIDEQLKLAQSIISKLTNSPS